MKSKWKLFLCIAIATLFFLPAVAPAGEIEELREELDELYQRLEVLEKEKDVDTGWANWVISGYADLGYRDARNEARDKRGTFFFGHFNPVFLFQMRDNVLFEGELEIELEDGETEVKLEYAQVDWLVHDNATLVFGKFLSPFNIFQERLHPSWINKLPTSPIMYKHHGGFLPTTELGAQVRGGINVGERFKVEYAVYLVNGPTLTTSGHHAGELEFGENFEDNNDNKAVGFRLNVLPIPFVDLGISFMHAAVDNANRDDADFLGFFASAQYKNLDFNFEWARAKQDLSLATIRTFTSPHPEEETDEEFQEEFLEERFPGSPFETDGFYFQGAYKFTDIPFPMLSEFLTRLELVARYEEVDKPWIDRDRNEEAFTIGLNYWPWPNMVFKVAYEFSKEEPQIDDDVFYFQVAYGF